MSIAVRVIAAQDNPSIPCGSCLNTVSAVTGQPTREPQKRLSPIISLVCGLILRGDLSRWRISSCCLFYCWSYLRRLPEAMIRSNGGHQYS
jgi:hypothetical protein